MERADVTDYLPDLEAENWREDIERFRPGGVGPGRDGVREGPPGLTGVHALQSKLRLATTAILYVQNLRIEEAKHLLETSDQAVDEIRFAIGYEDPSFFRRLFRRRTGVAPARYRRIFQPIHRGTPAAQRESRPTSPHCTGTR